MQRWGTLAHRNLPFKVWGMLVSCLGGKLSRLLLLTSTKSDAEKNLPMKQTHWLFNAISILLYLFTFSFYADIDECVTGNSECDVRADCVNTAGSYNCTCKTGFSGNGSTCKGMTRACNLKDWVQRKILFLIKRSKSLCWIAWKDEWCWKTCIAKKTGYHYSSLTMVTYFWCWGK